MSDNTRMAQLYFEDCDANNPIVSVVILHTSLKNGKYVNPDTSSHEPYSLYKWTKANSFKFTKEGNRWLAYALTINKDQHDVWAVALQRKYNNYVEYLTQKEGFWKKLGEDVVKGVCDAAIDVFDIADDEIGNLVFEKATDQLIHHLFTSGDGDVLMENWVHWKSYEIEFKFNSHDGSIHSAPHHTSCKVDRFGYHK